MNHINQQGFTIDINLNYNPNTDPLVYEEHLKALKDSGAVRIVHGRSNEKGRLSDMIASIHKLEMQAVCYTGVFGTENISVNTSLEQWTQRNDKGVFLDYGGVGNKGTAMMCPVSPYVESYLAPNVIDVVQSCGFDAIFIDIPWIMEGGCYCGNCHDLRTSGADNSILVRTGLKKFIEMVKAEIPDIKIGVNASAPGIYSHYWHGAEIENLSGLFEEYITEWNPFVFGNEPEIVTECILKAREKVNGDFYHATTCTEEDGKPYSMDKMVALLSAILKGGALPWLCFAGPTHQVREIGEAWNRSLNRIVVKE